ncbi:MAG: FAD-dependent oxidoreductase [Sandaracinus sp.]|nr:FAD-dependent oxidoreductase [Sandaracinus sp.]
MDESPEVVVVVIGAGVVGLACAAALARAGREVLVLERHTAPGQETSSRNSGVVHGGLYYPPGSLKAASCVEGRRALYAYCAERGVPHRKTGKLIVATDAEEEAALDALHANALENGVEGLSRWSAAELARREPALRGVGALHSAETGVVDAHGLMDALKAEARAHGALFLFGAEVEALERGARGWTVRTADGQGARAELVVNAAGLRADRVAERAGLDVDARGWRLHPWKGDYFALGPGAPRPEAALVYPMPARGGLGIHLTTDLGGQLLAGPDAAPLEGSLDGSRAYAVDEARREAFAASVSRYLPGLEPAHLEPGYRGIRPKRRADGAFADFVLEEAPEGLVHLLGIESPGLTAALALAERVRRLATRHD